MASAELSRRVEKVVGDPPLSELSELQRARARSPRSPATSPGASIAQSANPGGALSPAVALRGQRLILAVAGCGGVATPAPRDHERMVLIVRGARP